MERSKKVPADSISAIDGIFRVKSSNGSLSPLSYTKGLSVKLQGPYVNIARAHHEINALTSSLNRIRQDVNGFHTRIYKQTMTIAQSVGDEESTPCLASRQQYQQLEHPSSKPPRLLSSQSNNSLVRSSNQ